MPFNSNVAHSVHSGQDFGRDICELRAEFGRACNNRRGQAALVEEGQVGHELCDGLLKELKGERHFAKDKQSCFMVYL
jgi:hypothetical protein